jgi:hypothetical protein
MNEQEAMESIGLGKGNEANWVKFWLEPTKNDAKSAEEGRPIFEELEWISIRIAGSREERTRIARHKDKQDYPRHYAAFKNRESQEIVSGTPLTEWAGVTRSQVEELKWLSMLTVEQLSMCSDQNCQSMQGLLTLKQKALAYLESTKGSVEFEALRAENAALMKRLEALEEDAPKPKRKRRSKAEMEAARLNKDME